jgi:ornithine carbamoyltransferase
MTAAPTHLLAVHDLTRDEILSIFREAAALKAMRRRALPTQRLSGKTLGLFFEKPSTRTRVSFETGMNQRGEPIPDTARVLSRYVDGIMIRTFDHAEVEELARHATIPVINGLTDLHHPCQVLSDLFTIREKKRRWKGIKIAYVGDGNNVANSLIEGAAIMGMAISVACPSGYEPDASILEWAREKAERTKASIEILRDPYVAVKGADVLYTDVWTSMGQEKEQARRVKVLAPYQLNGKLVAAAHPDAIVMHCLPAHRGQEITADVLDGPQSVVFDQAENRLHVQKAILIRLLRDR